MEIHREKLIQTATAGLRRLDAVAAPIAIAAAILMIVVLDVDPALAILLSLGVYAGVHLVLPERNVPLVEVPEPIAPEREVIARSRAASAKIAESISGLQKESTHEQIKVSTQEQVQVIVTEIGMMMDAIEEDATENESRLAAAPLYYTRLVQPFGNFLERGLWLKRRKVRAADAQFEHLSLIHI